MATVTLPRQRSSHGWGNAYSPETQSCEPVAWGVSSKPFRYEPITKRLGEPTVSQTFPVGGPRSVTISSSDSLMPKPRPHTQIRAPVTRVYSAFSHVLWLRKSMAPHRVCVTAFPSCSGDGALSRGHVCQLFLLELRVRQIVWRVGAAVVRRGAPESPHLLTSPVQITRRVPNRTTVRVGQGSVAAPA